MWAEYDGDFVNIHRLCPFCRQAVMVRCLVRGYNAWQDGMLIQEALPELSPGERETLRCGAHETCFDLAHGEEEDDDVPDYGPGPEVDDQGGMSEYRHQLPTSEEW